MRSKAADSDRPVDRFASSFVLVVLALGCLMFWAVVPAAGIWFGGQLGNDFAQQLLLALGSILAGVVTMIAVLGWLNDLYLRITGGAVVEADGVTFRRRGPLEALLVGSLVPLGLGLLLWLILGKPTPGWL